MDMWRGLSVAALGVILLALPALGQRRGGGGGFAGHAGFSGGHAMVGGRGPMMSGRSSSFSGGFRGGPHFGSGFGRPGFGRPGRSPFLNQRHFFRTWPYAGYYGYPYWGYGNDWDYGDNSYAADSYQSYPPPDYSSSYGDSRTQADIDRLENEVDRLRQEREARESSATRSKSDSETTALVFRDKHTEEVKNYAIVGQTLWILSGERARKIPLNQLDIPATKKVNDDRGVDFQLPG